MEKTKHYYNEILIDTNLAGDIMSRSQLFIENNQIKELQINNPTSILSAIISLDKFVWDEKFLKSVDHSNDDETNSNGIMYSSYNE